MYAIMCAGVFFSYILCVILTDAFLMFSILPHLILISMFGFVCRARVRSPRIFDFRCAAFNITFSMCALAVVHLFT